VRPPWWEPLEWHGLGGRLLEGGLHVSDGALVNQNRNSLPASAVTQAS
jgi:hypothetical protein